LKTVSVGLVWLGNITNVIANGFKQKP